MCGMCAYIFTFLVCVCVFVCVCVCLFVVYSISISRQKQQIFCLLWGKCPAPEVPVFQCWFAGSKALVTNCLILVCSIQVGDGMEVCI